ncbi:MAG: hypothetical protein AAFR38_10205 [Planctomycetota bacterium]
MRTEPAVNAIDEMMEQASLALAATRYFEATALATRALARARSAIDPERMARICLPLQEARRQIRQLAVDDAAGRETPVTVIGAPEDAPRPLRPGCYLIQPPMIGADGRALRQAAERTKIPVFVLTREPLTKLGKWPIVGVTAEHSVRTRIDPPVPLERVKGRSTLDNFEGKIPLTWFEAAGEALGDSAIESIDPEHSPWWQMDDLLEALEAVPEHEKLHQALADTCRRAARAPRPTERRPSPLDDPFMF